MRAAIFETSDVELGGHDAPPRQERGPTPMSRARLWLLAVVLMVIVVGAWFVETNMSTVLAPHLTSASAGNLRFTPAQGWAPLSNPSQAPSGAVTYGRDGATFTVWAQHGASAEDVARQVTAQFFPVAYESGAYYVLNNGLAHSVQIRPEQPFDRAKVSMVTAQELRESAPGAPPPPSDEYAVIVELGPQVSGTTYMAGTVQWGPQS